jgi:glycosyltransferase involved in cell wall biosynthesis
MAATADSLHVLTVVSVAAPREGGGNAERAVQLARAFVRLGLRSTLLTLDVGDWQARAPQLEGGRLVALPCLLARFHVPAPQGRTLREIVRQADVVHMVGHWSPLQAMVAAAARREGVPWVMCPAGALPVFGRSKLFKRLFNAVFGHRLVREAAGWVAITRDEVAHFAAYGVSADRVEVIPNGVDEDEPAPETGSTFRARIGLPPEPYVLFMGRLSPIKGPDLLLEAFIAVAERQSALHLVFAGPDDGMQEGLATRAASAGLAARVHFPGFVGGAEKAAAYREAVLLAVPSRSEAMSIVAVECGLCGTPVLMTDRCGLRDLDEVDPRLTVPATSDGLAAGLDYALADASRRRNWGAQWQAIVRERFLWKDIAARMAGWLAAIARTKHRRPA